MNPFVLIALFAVAFAMMAYGWALLRAKESVIPVEDAPTRGMVATVQRIGRPFAKPQRISQKFGNNPAYYSRFVYSGVALKGHNGIDYAVPVGTPVLAVDDGIVMWIGFEAGGFGHYVKLRHVWGESLYAHLQDVGVMHGDAVREGQQIARSGNSGGSTGPHLHFGVRVNPYSRKDGWGGFSDPLPMLAEGGYTA